MFSARDKNGQIRHLLVDTQVPKGEYFCPVCNGLVRLKKGEIMQPHFAHVSLSNCYYHFENESKEHLNLKAALFRWAKKNEKVEVEAVIPELDQVADILVADRIALEIQCSPLSKTRLWQRTKQYQQAGYQVIWLLGEKLWLKKTLTPLQKHFLYFSQNMGFHLWELDEKRSLLRLKYLIHEDLHGQVQYIEKNFVFEEGELLDIFRLPFQKQPLVSFSAKTDTNICHYIRQQLYYQNPKWMKRQETCYQKGENLLSKSADDFYPQVRPVRADEPFCQIYQDLSAYYENFLRYYQNSQNKKSQIVYSPAFYTRNLH